MVFLLPRSVPDAGPQARRGPRLLWLAGLGWLLAGCSVMPQPEPGIPLPARFDGASARPASDITRWWTRFGSTALTGLVDRADADNFDVAAAAARIEQADAQARIAGASLLPALSAAADASRSQRSGTSGGRIASPSVGNSVSGSLAASYQLDLWGRNRDLLRAAENQSLGARFAFDTVRLSTQVAVVNAYLQLAAARDRLAIAEGNVASAERILGVIRERLGAGTASALDRAQQEGLVAQQRASIPPLRQNLETSRNMLALLIGRPPEGFSMAAVSLRSLQAPMARPGLPADLLLRRPDIRLAEARLAAAEANVEASRKALLPAIQLTGQAGLQSAALNLILRPESAIWSLAAGVTQPIFDGGRLRAEVALSEAQRQELLEAYRQAIVSALVDVENALVAVRESAARERAQAVAVARAREAFGFAEQRFREGTIDLQSLLNTQSTLFQTQDGLVQARLARLQASVGLFQALGGDFVGGTSLHAAHARARVAITPVDEEAP
ncbi:MAG: efflux transporter outer membrane subunit [Beijerinckiaceae bacterium]|nr:efflux transporter outer membrane subunit [Beijerinckiaceae bacterium]